MTDETTDVEETTTEESTVDESATLHDAIAGLAASDETATGDEATDSEESDYEPNFKYSIRDEEHEFDERLRGLIKSKEDEDYVRDLVTRADGLEGYKTKLSERDTAYSTLEGTTSKLKGAMTKLHSLREGKKYDKLFEALGISDEAVMEYSLQRAQEEELPDEQKELIRRNRELENQIADRDGRLVNLESQVDNSVVDEDLRQLDGFINGETYHPIALAMKDTLGIEMSDVVIKEGTHQFRMTGKEPSIESVVKQVADQYGKLLTLTNKPGPEEETLPVVKTKPKIPGVKTGGTTTVDKPIGSLDDLRKLAAQIEIR